MNRRFRVAWRLVEPHLEPEPLAADLLVIPIHFANQAQTIGYTGVNILRYGLVGYDTGWVTNVDPNILTSYADEIGALSGWYLNNGHLYDNAWVWTGDSAVDRSNPWGWY